MTPPPAKAVDNPDTHTHTHTPPLPDPTLPPPPRPFPQVPINASTCMVVDTWGTAPGSGSRSGSGMVKLDPDLCWIFSHGAAYYPTGDPALQGLDWIQGNVKQYVTQKLAAIWHGNGSAVAGTQLTP